MSISLYKYFGLLIGGHRRKLSLLSAKFMHGDSHIAVWYGVGGPDNWIQGGVEMSAFDDHPWTYVEQGSHGNQQRIRLWKTKLGKKHTVTITRRIGGEWNVWIDGRGPFHHKAYGSPVSMLETYHGAIGRATVGNKVIRTN